MKSEPSYISETYLSMLISQYQGQGYSIFTLVGSLPNTEADQMALLVPEPSAEVIKASNRPKAVVEEEDEAKMLSKAMEMSMDNENDDFERILRESAMENDHNDKALNAAIASSMKEYEASDFEMRHSVHTPGATSVTPRVAPSGNGQSMDASDTSKLSAEELRKIRLAKYTF